MNAELKKWPDFPSDLSRFDDEQVNLILEQANEHLSALFDCIRDLENKGFELLRILLAILAVSAGFLILKNPEIKPTMSGPAAYVGALGLVIGSVAGIFKLVPACLATRKFHIPGNQPKTLMTGKTADKVWQASKLDVAYRLQERIEHNRELTKQAGEALKVAITITWRTPVASLLAACLVQALSLLGKSAG